MSPAISPWATRPGARSTLAGLHPLSAGHVTLAGRDLDRPDRRTKGVPAPSLVATP
jgi:hypothetical protein